MKRIALLIALGWAGALLLPALSHANSPPIPCGWDVTLPDYIDVVGRGPDGQPDTLRGTFVVVFRDCFGNPVPDASVYVDFGACPDIVLDRQQMPPLIVDCPRNVVWRKTDADGRAKFCIVGAGTNQGAGAGAGAQGVIIYVSGTGMGRPTATVADQNGAVTNSGVELTDLTAWLRDWGSGTYYGRSDYDHDGAVSLPDVVVLLRVWGTGSSVAGPNDACP